MAEAVRVALRPHQDTRRHLWHGRRTPPGAPKLLPGNRLDRIEKTLVDPNILSLYQLSETLNKADALAAEIAITINSIANGEEKSQVLSHAGNVAGRHAQNPACSPLAHPIAANQMLHHRSTPQGVTIF
jgi:hypothetical protein